jgi:hypothetical protein
VEFAHARDDGLSVSSRSVAVRVRSVGIMSRQAWPARMCRGCAERTSCDSESTCTRKVGSSFWKRFKAREKLGDSLPSGRMEREMTGSGTNIDV